MLKKTKISFTSLGLAVSLLVMLMVFISPRVQAAPKNPVDCPSGRVLATDNTKCAPLGNDCNGNTAQTCLNKNPIVTNLNKIITFLSAGIGIIVVGVIILGGIQYSMAGDNATATAAARQRITNGLIALVAFIFMYAFLQWLVPGGVFNS